MKKLCTEKRIQVLKCLSEGVSMSSTVRLTGVALNTVTKVMLEAGEACMDHHRRHAMELSSSQVQIDEQWSFVGCKEAMRGNALKRHEGDVWIWTCICKHSKFLVDWHIGRRTIDDAQYYCAELGKRFISAPQVSTDGMGAYREAVPMGFGECDFGQMVKKYAEHHGKLMVTEVTRHVVTGNPDLSQLTTTSVERHNLTTRMTNRRMTRLTNAFSKKLANHKLMMAFTYFVYNFLRKHSTIRMTPAEAMGIEDHAWSWEELVQMTDSYLKAKQEKEFEKIFRLKHEGSFEASSKT